MTPATYIFDLYADDYEDDDTGEGPGGTKIKVDFIVAAHAHFAQVPGRVFQVAVYPRRVLDCGGPL